MELQKTFEEFVRGAIKRYSPTKQQCKKCGHIEEIIFATNCSVCGKDLPLDKKTLHFACYVMQLFNHKYSTSCKVEAIDQKIFSLLCDVQHCTHEDSLLVLSERNALRNTMTSFFDFLHLNKVVIGNANYGLAVFPDFTIFFNKEEACSIQEHFGNIEFALPYYLGSFGYFMTFYESLNPTLWQRFKNLL